MVSVERSRERPARSGWSVRRRLHGLAVAVVPITRPVEAGHNRGPILGRPGVHWRDRSAGRLIEPERGRRQRRRSLRAASQPARAAATGSGPGEEDTGRPPGGAASRSLACNRRACRALPSSNISDIDPVGSVFIASMDPWRSPSPSPSGDGGAAPSPAAWIREAIAWILLAPGSESSVGGAAEDGGWPEASVLPSPKGSVADDGKRLASNAQSTPSGVAAWRVADTVIGGFAVAGRGAQPRGRARAKAIRRLRCWRVDGGGWAMGKLGGWAVNGPGLGRDRLMQRRESRFIL